MTRTKRVKRRATGDRDNTSQLLRTEVLPVNLVGLALCLFLLSNALFEGKSAPCSAFVVRHPALQHVQAQTCGLNK